MYDLLLPPGIKGLNFVYTRNQEKFYISFDFSKTSDDKSLFKTWTWVAKSNPTFMSILLTVDYDRFKRCMTNTTKCLI